MKNKHFKVVLDGQAFDVEIRELANDGLQVTVNGEVHHLTVEEIQSESHASSTPARAPSQPLPAVRPVQAVQTQAGVLTAPMPGDIVEFQVKVGDMVEAGQAVCVLEAMKMKNILRASQPGRVSKLLVRIGQTVEYGTELVRFA